MAGARGAIAVAAAVLAVYVLTLAPTVTFWDAGELIAAAHTLGIPHPPGTPLFVLLAHVWALAIPFGEYAARTNLLSATASAAAAGLLFLVARETTARFEGKLVAVGGAAVAAFAGAFTLTNWQNSNETEVYAVAMLVIAALAWLVYVWRRRRGTDAEVRVLLLMVYLLGLSVGKHLLALLVGPAVVAFMASTLASQPAETVERRRAEWAQLAVVAGVWTLLVGTGLGSATLFAVGAGLFAAAAAIAAWARIFRFALLAFGVAVAGVSIYVFLYLRANQQPIINEADPSTLSSLLDVLRRAQYPVRTPFDDPTIPHGPDNPGRNLTLIGLQLLNYLAYFDWQWARSIRSGFAFGEARLPVRTLVTLVFVWLGLRGLFAQRRADRAGWWLLLVLFLTTGFGLVGYMNFKPGFGIGYDLYPDPADHEVRERDYFFVVSFVVWGLWAGIGAADLARHFRRRSGAAVPMRAAAIVALSVPLAPLVLNWTAASRRHGPESRLAADFAYDLLNTVPPYGVLFTYGDNDTFPLWWAQEVAGIRRDVAVVCLALANTPWYLRQLRQRPVRPFNAEAAPPVWRGGALTPPSWPLHTLSDSEIAAMMPQQIGQPLTVDFGAFQHTYPAGTVFYIADIAAIRIVQENAGRRALVWGLTSGGELVGLRDRMVQQGLGFRLEPAGVDGTAPALYRPRFGSVPIDVPLTQRLVWETYRYGGLREPNGRPLDATAEDIARTLALPFLQLAEAYHARGDTTRLRKALEAAERIGRVTGETAPGY